MMLRLAGFQGSLDPVPVTAPYRCRTKGLCLREPKAMFRGLVNAARSRITGKAAAEERAAILSSMSITKAAVLTEKMSSKQKTLY